MTDQPTLAHRALETPDEAIEKSCVELKRVSEASESESRMDLEMDDGSVIILRSRMGGETDRQAFASMEQANRELEPLEDPA